MLIFFATETQINEAIERANEVYGNNLIWDLKLSPNIHPVLKVWGVNASIHVTDCKGPGHRLAHPAIHGGRPVEIFSACWHVYYQIFQFLPGDAAVQFDRELYYVRDQKYPVWAENRGSTPILITQLCECRRPKRFPNPRKGERWQDLYIKVRLPRFPNEKTRIKIRGNAVS
jgi:hypothetical protein